MALKSRARSCEEVSNFLFVEPSDALGRNPFLIERIRAIEPTFDGCFPTTRPGRPVDGIG